MQNITSVRICKMCDTFCTRVLTLCFGIREEKNVKVSLHFQFSGPEKVGSVFTLNIRSP